MPSLAHPNQSPSRREAAEQFFYFDKQATDGERIAALEGVVETLLRRVNELGHHVHEQNPGGITSRPRKDKRVGRRSHREVVPL